MPGPRKKPSRIWLQADSLAKKRNERTILHSIPFINETTKTTPTTKRATKERRRRSEMTKNCHVKHAWPTIVSEEDPPRETTQNIRSLWFPRTRVNKSNKGINENWSTHSHPRRIDSQGTTAGNSLPSLSLSLEDPLEILGMESMDGKGGECKAFRRSIAYQFITFVLPLPVLPTKLIILEEEDPWKKREKINFSV